MGDHPGLECLLLDADTFVEIMSALTAMVQPHDPVMDQRYGWETVRSSVD